MTLEACEGTAHQLVQNLCYEFFAIGCSENIAVSASRDVLDPAMGVACKRGVETPRFDGVPIAEQLLERWPNGWRRFH